MDNIISQFAAFCPVFGRPDLARALANDPSSLYTVEITPLVSGAFAPGVTTSLDFDNILSFMSYSSFVAPLQPNDIGFFAGLISVNAWLQAPGAGITPDELDLYVAPPDPMFEIRTGQFRAAANNSVEEYRWLAFDNMVKFFNRITLNGGGFGPPHDNAWNINFSGYVVIFRLKPI